MITQKFPLGARVKLITEATVMTVTGYKSEFSVDIKDGSFNYAICKWNADGQQHELTLHVDTLQTVVYPDAQNFITQS